MTLDREAYITEHFQWKEFLHSEAAERAGVAFPEPPEDIQANIRKVAAKAEEARTILGVPVGIHSGWRPTEPVDINALAGSVSKTSAHIEGLAADLSPDGMTVPDALRTLVNHPTYMEGVDQLINERGCLHLGLPCKASGYEPRHEVRGETYIQNPKTKQTERHYPLLFVWKPGWGNHA